MTDEELIEKKIDLINENLEYLEGKDLKDADFERVQAVKYSLLESIEACLDIANHIISSEGYKRAETYGEMFEILGKEEILEEELVSGLAQMAGFRNLLLHRYGDIRHDQLQEIIEEDLNDFTDFIQQIQEFMVNQ